MATKRNTTSSKPTQQAQQAQQQAPNVTVPKVQPAPLYVLGRPYTPRAKTVYGHHTNWQAIVAALQQAPQGLTLQQLQALAQQLPQQVQANHTPYCKYAIRRGWLVQAQ